MHFHDLAWCLNCGDYVQYSTPISQILILWSQCENCNERKLVGRTRGGWCVVCLDLHYAEETRST